MKYKTLKNKIYAALLITIGMVPVVIDGDGTFLVLAGCIGIPMFFAKDNWIY